MSFNCLATFHSCHIKVLMWTGFPSSVMKVTSCHRSVCTLAAFGCIKSNISQRASLTRSCEPVLSSLLGSEMGQKDWFQLQIPVHWILSSLPWRRSWIKNSTKAEVSNKMRYCRIALSHLYVYDLMTVIAGTVRWSPQQPKCHWPFEYHF